MEEKKCECPPGAPAWLATFADLMSLLMCFFVLLLSFSEMDVRKFRQIAGSVKYAFGVQNQVELKDIPKGTSVIAQEYRPGKPEPTPIEVIMQKTTDVTKPSLEFQDGETDRSAGKEEEQQESATSDPAVESEQGPEQSKSLAELEEKLEKKLSEDINSGIVELDNLGQQLIIRIRENGSFPSGSAFLQPKFQPVVRQIAQLVKDVPGSITIAGHTDDTPLDSELYRSNWDLSAQRAVSVAQEMQGVKGFDSTRMQIEGFAGNKPKVANDSVASRALNRRVEIAITQGKAKESEAISANDPVPKIGAQ
ncbi:MAG: flagellar motor protein MotB [Vibrionaceae bacterium]